MPLFVFGPGPVVERTAFATLLFQNTGSGVGDVFLLASVGGTPYGAWFRSEPTPMFLDGGSSSESIPGTSLAMHLRPRDGWPGDVVVRYAAFDEAGAFLGAGSIPFNVIDVASTPLPIPIGLGQGGIGFGLD